MITTPSPLLPVVPRVLSTVTIIARREPKSRERKPRQIQVITGVNSRRMETIVPRIFEKYEILIISPYAPSIYVRFTISSPSRLDMRRVIKAKRVPNVPGLMLCNALKRLTLRLNNSGMARATRGRAVLHLSFALSGRFVLSPNVSHTKSFKLNHKLFITNDSGSVRVLVRGLFVPVASRPSPPLRLGPSQIRLAKPFRLRVTSAQKRLTFIVPFASHLLPLVFDYIKHFSVFSKKNGLICVSFKF